MLRQASSLRTAARTLDDLGLAGCPALLRVVALLLVAVGRAGAHFRLGRSDLGKSAWYTDGQGTVQATWRYPIDSEKDDERRDRILARVSDTRRRRAITRRCALTRGTWCYEYFTQKPVPWRTQPRGKKACKADCNGTGRCDYDTGTCRCSAGWRGDACEEREDRECTRAPKTWSEWEAFPNLIGLCSGYCDKNIGMCFCNNGTYARQHYAHGLPFTAAPGPITNVGRPLSWFVQPAVHVTDNNGVLRTLSKGHAPEEIWGENGWCTDPEPPSEVKNPFFCHLDNLGGPGCDQPVASTCVNQCGAHGTCHLGFCSCDEGWFGDDCSRLVEGREATAARKENHLQRHTRTRVLDQELTGHPKKRLRPLIYVYDMKTLFTSKMLQWRLEGGHCLSRHFTWTNTTSQTWNNYMLDFALHEMLLQSEHLTRDPEEADFFYMPIYGSCFIFPIFGYQHFPFFFESGAAPATRPVHGRTAAAMYMYLDAVRWVQREFPYWNRTGGADHLVLATHDEGSCWMPNEARGAVLLTHWAPLQFPRMSRSDYYADKYSNEWPSSSHELQVPGDHFKHLWGGPCFDPRKDILMPGYKPTYAYANSPLLGKKTLTRDVLLFLRGDVGKTRGPVYSEGVRQSLYKHAVAGSWADKYNMLIGDRHDAHVQGDYGELLKRSKFCVVATGDGFSMRAEDALLHGCVPLVIMDNVLPVWDPHLDWDAFGVRIAKRDIPRLPEILGEIVDSGHLKDLQRNVGRVWKRFSYASYYPFDTDVRAMRDLGKANRPNATLSLPEPVYDRVVQDDAFETLMAILYHKATIRKPRGM